MKQSVCAILMTLAAVCVVHAQWAEQSITLNPGWNAVFLEIQPGNSSCDAVFAGIPVESVWSWNRKFTSIQFIKDPDTLTSRQSEWFTWYPTNHPQAFLKTLYGMQGGKAFLIKLTDDASPAALTVRGRPVIPTYRWYPNSFNLAGFFVDPDNQPTFKKYFSSSHAFNNQAVYSLNQDGHWVQISDLSTAQIEPGKAYWIKCNGHSDFAGPLSLVNVFGEGLSFDSYLLNKEIRIKNNSGSSKTVKIRSVPITVGSAESRPLTVPLAYWNADPAKRRFMWDPLPEELSSTLDTSRELKLSLVVRRPNMTDPDGTYRSIIEITDGEGSRLRIPVSAKPLPRAANVASMPLPRFGLWVGQVKLDKVSQVNTSDIPAPTPSPMLFRLIVHQDSNGTARLLQHVTVMQKADGDETNMVLVTNDALIPQFGGGQQTPDDQRLGQRFSSVVFGFDQPRSLAYSPAALTLTDSITIGYNDPLNPFKHLYHPDHNNLENYETKLPEGVQSFDVTRSVTMKFSTNIVAGASASSWGDTVAGGTYKETLKGLHHKPIYVQGTFLLNHVTDIPVLYDGN
jgi:hypothetical protein